MIKRTLDLMAALLYVMYGRMSDPRQNKSSPDQQFREIEERIVRSNRPWKEIKRYRDNGISGRKTKQRFGFQSMLRDIETGVVKPQLILVDTPERFGRSDEMAEIRRILFNKHKIVILSADSDFADPTGSLGRMMALTDNFRSNEEGRIKAHNVTRGKKDTVHENQWPGGSAPFGFELKKILDPTNRLTGYYSILEPIPEEIALVLALFERAARTGEGRDRLAKWWNECPAIPARFKSITSSKIAYILANKIYIGILVWGKYNTDIIDDVRVIVRNPNGPSAIAENFCNPVVPIELFREVERQRKIRSDAHLAKQEVKDEAPAGFRPCGRGLTLKYLLAGLVRCAECGASMRTVPSRHPETNMDGDLKVYAYAYHSCPRHSAGACGNGRYFREDKVREAVVGRLRAKLLPPAEAGAHPAWLPVLLAFVEADIALVEARQPDRTAARTARLEALDKQQRGWLLSLGDPGLPMSLRSKIQEYFNSAAGEADDLRAEAESSAALASVKNRLINPAVVVEALRSLGDILADENPTLGNLELSKHMDRVDCHADGKVVLHGTWLGVLGEGAHLLTRTEPAGELDSTGSGLPKITPRLKSRRYVPSLASQDNADVDQTQLLDPARFEGFGNEFLWSEEIFIERELYWYEENAKKVARERRAGKTHEKLAEQFGVSVPTIRAALKLAETTDPELAQMPRKMKAGRWEDANYEEVGRRRAQGESVANLALSFGVSEPLIRNAVRIAAAGGPEAKPPMAELPAETTGESAGDTA